MQNKVKIYTITITKAIEIGSVGTGFALEPWGKDTDRIQGFDDGGVEYYLPDGYSVAECVAGSLCVYDTEDKYAGALVEKHGQPAIMIDQGKVLVLKEC